jgi:protein SCO1
VRSSRRTPLAALLSALLALVLLAGCGGGSGSEDEFTGTVVDPPFRVDPTPLATTDGGTLSLADPGTRLTLVFFGYTECGDVCPLVMANLSTALTQLDPDEREQVRLAFVTTDPATDKPDVIRAYLERYDPDAIGLRTDLAGVARVARSVGIFVADAEELASGGYDLGSHGSQVVAVDGSGEAPVFWDQDTSAGQFRADIESLLSQS